MLPYSHDNVKYVSLECCLRLKLIHTQLGQVYRPTTCLPTPNKVFKMITNEQRELTLSILRIS
jgi:hypothetical protein